MTLNDKERGLFLYECLNDALKGELGIINWLKKNATSVFDNKQTLVVVPTRSVGVWLKGKILSEEVNFCGIQFLELWQLRKILCKHLDVNSQAIGKDILSFFIKLFCQNENSLRNQIDISSNPDICLETTDTLAYYRFLSDKKNSDQQEIFKNFPTDLQEFVNFLTNYTIEDAKIWTPVIDKNLAKKSENFNASKSDPTKIINAKNNPAEINLIFLGFTCKYAKFANLIKSAINTANNISFYLPAPTFINASHEEAWINFLEKQCDCPSEFCEVSEPYSKNIFIAEGLSGKNSENLETPNANKDNCDIETKTPYILAGDWQSHIELIFAKIIKLCQKHSNETDFRLAIVFPQNNKTAVSLAKLLSENSITFKDNIGIEKKNKAEDSLLKLIVKYYQNSRAIQFLREIIIHLHNHKFPICTESNIATCLTELNKTFSYLQVRDCSLLQQNLKPQTQESKFISNLLQILHPLPANSSLENYANKFTEISQSLNCTNGNISNLVDKILNFTNTQNQLAQNLEKKLQNTTLENFLFLLEAILAGESQTNYINKNQQPFANVVLTTFPAAQSQQWHSTIFTDSNEKYWQAKNNENPLLNDTNIIKQNQNLPNNSLPIPTSTDNYLFDKIEFINFLRECQNPPIFIGYAESNSEPDENVWDMNEMAFSSLVEHLRSKDFLPEIPETEIANKLNHFFLNLPINSRKKNLTNNHARNQNFHYNKKNQLDFSNISQNLAKKLQAKPWNSSQLSTIHLNPPAFAIKHYFQTEPSIETNFLINEPNFFGSRLHKILQKTLTPQPLSEEGFINLNLIPNLEELRQNTKQLILEQKELPFFASNKTSSEQKLQMLESMVNSCLTTINNLVKKLNAEDNPESAKIEFAPEKKIKTNLNCDSAEFLLTAKFDLVIKIQNKESTDILIIDFKTGKNFKVARADFKNGKQLQFLAYFLTAEKIFKSKPSIFAITPLQNQAIPVPEDMLNAGLPVIEQLANTQKNLIFKSEFDLDDFSQNKINPPIATL